MRAAKPRFRPAQPNPQSETAVELYSKVGTLSGALKGLLKSVGLSRRARELEGAIAYA